MLVNGNLAYKDNYARVETVEVQKKTDNRIKTTAVKKSKAKNEISYAAKLVMVLVTALSAVFMIVQYVTANETQSALNDVRDQYEFAQAVTAQKTFELEQSIDLSKIEEEAVSRLGMQRPDKHQIVYLDVKKNDATIRTADQVEGISNRAKELIEGIKSYMIEFFSI